MTDFPGHRVWGEFSFDELIQILKDTSGEYPGVAAFVESFQGNQRLLGIKKSIASLLFYQNQVG